MTPQIRAAIHTLSAHDKGRDTLAHLLAWLDSSGCAMDYEGQEAVLTLLFSVWGSHAGFVLDELRGAVEPALAKRDAGA